MVKRCHLKDTLSTAHFELSGWAEITVVIRFWIIAGLSVALGLGLFYAQWVVK